MLFSSVAASSYLGAKALQWPHHGAKNSARTRGCALTNSWKVSVVKETTLESAPSADSAAETAAAAPRSLKTRGVNDRMMISKREKRKVESVYERRSLWGKKETAVALLVYVDIYGGTLE